MIPNTRPIRLGVKCRDGETSEQTFARFMERGPFLMKLGISFGLTGSRVVDDKRGLEFVWEIV